MSAGTQYRLFDPPTAEAQKLASAPAGDPDKLRPYQREAVTATLAQLETVRATLGVAHCGSGKTQIGGALIRAWKGRVLWLAHRDFLLQQARERIEQMCGEYVSVEKAEQQMDASRVVVGSVQTLRGGRLTTCRRDLFSLIIIDEAHHAPAPGYRAVFEHFEGAKLFGLTATPKRHDKIGQWNVFESEAFRRDIDVGIAEGYFVPPVPVSRLIDSIDLSKCKTTAGDLNLGDLEKEIATNAGAIAQLAAEECGDRPTLIYTPGVPSAHAVADTLNEIKPGSARTVDQDTPGNERRAVLGDFAGGRLQFIVNCAIYLEGLDVPHARAIVIARPTKSEGLFVQMAGRGGRPEGWIGQLETAPERLAAIAASSKPNFLLLDVTGKPGRHSLITAARALAGKAIPDRVKDRAQENMRKAPGKTLGEALKDAEDELDAEDKAAAERIAKAAAAAEIKARRSSFDPFRRFGMDEDGTDMRGISPQWAAEPPSVEQLAWMRDNKLLTAKSAKKLTAGTVQRLQDQARKWRREGKANFRQRHVLSKAGCPVDVSFEVAGRLIGTYKANWWRRLTPEQVAACMPPEPGWDG